MGKCNCYKLMAESKGWITQWFTWLMDIVKLVGRLLILLQHYKHCFSNILHLTKLCKLAHSIMESILSSSITGWNSAAADNGPQHVAADYRLQTRWSAAPHHPSRTWAPLRPSEVQVGWQQIPPTPDISCSSSSPLAGGCSPLKPKPPAIETVFPPLPSG